MLYPLDTITRVSPAGGPANNGTGADDTKTIQRRHQTSAKCQNVAETPPKQAIVRKLTYALNRLAAN